VNILKEKSIVGDLINFRGLVYAPVNENGVILLFGKVVDDLNMYIEEVKPGFPDCIARRFVGKGWERIAIEFEYRSSNFVQHGHDANFCDLIVCWKHDWKDCPIEVIELKTEIQGLENWPILKPGATEKQEKFNDKNIDILLKNAQANTKIRDWYEDIFEKVSNYNDRLWAKVGNKYIGWYSPERAFVSVRPKKTSIRIKVFSRGEILNETKVANAKLAPRWAAFTVKNDSDIDKAVEIIIESNKRIIDAIKAGEPTSYFSGGESIGASSIEIEDEDEEVEN
jgi:predicted transport protein